VLSYQLISGLAVEPVTTAEFKTYQRIDGTDQDTIIPILLKNARLAAEQYTDRQLITATYRWFANYFSLYEIKLPVAPLQSISTIKYRDDDLQLVTLISTRYEVDAASDPGRVRPANNQNWPVVKDRYQGVEITYTAGYGDTAASVPEPFKQFILAYAAWHYEHRDDGEKLPATLFGLLDPYRLAVHSWC